MTGWFVFSEKLLAHPSESSERDGMQEQSLNDASTGFHRRCVVIDCAQTLSFLFQAALFYGKTEYV